MDRLSHQSSLDLLNAAIESMPTLPTREDADGRYLLVTGSPRSGTTLMMQRLQSNLSLTTIDHLSAALWKRPDLGLVLSEHLARLTPEYSSSFSSNYGATDSWQEPHEFSYFWRDAMNCNPHDEAEVRAASIDRVCRLLSNAAAQALTPLCVKAFPALWAGERILEHSPNARIIVMLRSGESLEASLRLLWDGTPTGEWKSLRPTGWNSVVHSAQATRVRFQHEALVESASTLASCGDRRVLAVHLEQLAAEPESVMASIGAWLDS